MDTSKWWEDRMQAALDRRKAKGTLRKLHATPTDESSKNDNKLLLLDEKEEPRDTGILQHPVDFASNDYLGLAHDPVQHVLVDKAYQQVASAMSDGASQLVPRLGATGSRLLSGDSATFHALEAHLAVTHNRQAAILCNSGYDANLAVVSTLPCDCIVYDEYAHNSLHMGMRLWQSQNAANNSSSSSGRKQTISFRHNSTRDLQRTLEAIQTTDKRIDVIVIIESVYSMDGDVAPVKDMLDVAGQFGAQVVVDEAHGLGIYGIPTANRNANVAGGTGVLAAERVESHAALACSIHTFGKGAGCHGAVVCGSRVFRDYLVNYGYPLIYSTALPLHSLVSIRCSYDTMTGTKGDRLRETVFRLVHMFRENLEPFLQTCHKVHLLSSTSPIQALMIPGNAACTDFCQRLFVKSGKRIQLFPIKSPTVEKGQERVRIILHSHNTTYQVDVLVRLIQSTLRETSFASGLSKL